MGKIFEIFYTYSLNDRRIVRICEVVERFLWKQFWFYLRILSTSVLIRLSSYRSKSHASVVLCDSEVTFFWEKGGCCLLSISLLYFLYTALQNWRCISSNFLVFHTSRDISSKSADFLLLLFQYGVKFFLRKLSKFYD